MTIAEINQLKICRDCRPRKQNEEEKDNNVTEEAS